MAERIIFICLAEHLADGSLAADIRARYAAHQPVIVSLDHVTAGQAWLLLIARELIDNDQPLLIYNADTYCPTNLATLLGRNSTRPMESWTCFRPKGQVEFRPRGRCDAGLETAEKRRISPWATTGLYYFRRGSDFVRHANAMIAADDRSNNEFYVAPLYNRLIAAGGVVLANPIDEVWVLGTPEDLAHF